MTFSGDRGPTGRDDMDRDDLGSEGIGGVPMDRDEVEELGVDEHAATDADGRPAIASPGPWIALALVLLVIFVVLVVAGLLPTPG